MPSINISTPINKKQFEEILETLGFQFSEEVFQFLFLSKESEEQSLPATQLALNIFSFFSQRSSDAADEARKFYQFVWNVIEQLVQSTMDQTFSDSFLLEEDSPSSSSSLSQESGPLEVIQSLAVYFRKLSEALYQSDLHVNQQTLDGSHNTHMIGFFFSLLFSFLFLQSSEFLIHLNQ